MEGLWICCLCLKSQTTQNTMQLYRGYTYIAWIDNVQANCETDRHVQVIITCANNWGFPVWATGLNLELMDYKRIGLRSFALRQPRHPQRDLWHTLFIPIKKDFSHLWQSPVMVWVPRQVPYHAFSKAMNTVYNFQSLQFFSTSIIFMALFLALPGLHIHFLSIKHRTVG